VHLLECLVLSALVRGTLLAKQFCKQKREGVQEQEMYIRHYFECICFLHGRYLLKHSGTLEIRAASKYLLDDYASRDLYCGCGVLGKNMWGSFGRIGGAVVER
jgi:hypothetical protein